MQLHRCTIVPLATAALLLSACGGDDSTGVTADDGGTSSGSTTAEAQDEPDQTSTDPDQQGDGAGDGENDEDTSQGSGGDGVATTVTTAAGGSSDEGQSSETSTAGQPADATEEGTITIALEPVEGYFIEGFEIGLRVETGSGEVLASTLWTEFVDAQGGGGIDAYYDSVFEQQVPAGPVVVLATANIGIGPGPEIPDPLGELRCRLEVEVPAGGTAGVEVRFTNDASCLAPR